MIWDVPETWTLEEAATVPLVYYTVYLAFFVTSKIEKGKTILIHAGTGGGEFIRSRIENILKLNFCNFSRHGSNSGSECIRT